MNSICALMLLSTTIMVQSEVQTEVQNKVRKINKKLKNKSFDKVQK